MIKFKIFLFCIVILISCGDIGLVGEEHESGFNIEILNYSETEYVGCSFFMGAYNNENKFIAVDSLLYPDLIISIKGEGEEFSTTKPFETSKAGLNEFGFWSPKLQEIEEISGNKGIVFKIELSNGTFDLTRPFNFSNGTLTPDILADGTILF